MFWLRNKKKVFGTHSSLKSCSMYKYVINYCWHFNNYEQDKFHAQGTERNGYIFFCLNHLDVGDVVA